MTMQDRHAEGLNHRCNNVMSQSVIEGGTCYETAQASNTRRSLDTNSFTTLSDQEIRDTGNEHNRRDHEGTGPAMCAKSVRFGIFPFGNEQSII